MRLLTTFLMFVCVYFFLSPFSAQAKSLEADAQMSRHFSIASVELTEEASAVESFSDLYQDQFDARRDEEDDERPPTLDDQLNTAGHVIDVTKDLVALGNDVWDLFEKGRPVKSIDLNPISILPRIDGDQGWMSLYEMYGWSYPQVKTYRVAFKNYLGMTVCDFKFSVEYQYGGRSEGLNGKYLTAINVVPNTVSLKWGFNLDARAKFIGATNMSQTPDFVLAAGRFQIDYQVSSILSSESQSISFFVLADGRLQMLSH